MDQAELVNLVTDPRTGLFTNAYFQLRVDEEFKRSMRYGWSYSLVLMDVHGLEELRIGRIAHVQAVEIVANSAFFTLNGFFVLTDNNVAIGQSILGAKVAVAIVAPPAPAHVDATASKAVTPTAARCPYALC